MKTLVLPLLAIAGAGSLTGTALAASSDPAQRIAWSKRLTWGATQAALTADAPGPGHWLDVQLAGSDASLPTPAADLVQQMRISREPMAQIVVEEDAQNCDANTLTDPGAKKKAARDTYQKSMNELADQARQRSVLRDL